MNAPMQTIQLTPEEFSLAAHVANLRFTLSELARLKDALYKKSYFEGYIIHLWGCMGELAYCKWSGQPWKAGVNKFKKEADVGKDIEVRHRSKDDWDLIIRPGDDPEKKYVLTTGEGPDIHIHGWILGKDGMKDEFRATHGGHKAAFFVPQGALHPIESFREGVAQPPVGKESSLPRSVSKVLAAYGK